MPPLSGRMQEDFGLEGQARNQIPDWKGFLLYKGQNAPHFV
jgi:hypothetical protein